EDVYFVEVVLFEDERRARAGVLVVARAVRYQGAAPRDFPDPPLELHAPDAQAPRYLVLALLPVHGVARVKEDRLAAPLDQPPGFVRRDSLRLSGRRHRVSGFDPPGGIRRTPARRRFRVASLK